MLSPDQMQSSSGSRGKAALWAGVLFALTFQKYVSRDAVSQSVGSQGILEVALTLLPFMIVLLLSRGMPRRLGLHPAVWLFGIYGVFALASAINSFSVKLSVMKSGLYFAVLLMAYLISELQLSLVFLDGVYRGYIVTLLAGFALAVASPAQHPLFLIDSYIGRTRLNLFATPPNSVGEVCGLLFLLALVLPLRTRWYWQAFLFGVNIFAGEKTATASLAICAALIFVFGSRNISRRLGIAFAATIVGAAFFFCVAAGVIHTSPGTFAGHAAESIYGTHVSDEVSNLDGRAQVWAKAVELARGSVGLGFGFDGARNLLISAVAWSGHAHNGILQAALSAGLIGMVALLIGWAIVVRYTLSRDRTWNVRIMSLQLYLFSLAMIGPVFDSPSYFTILLLVVLLYTAMEGVVTTGFDWTTANRGMQAAWGFSDEKKQMA
jgi:O-antigen ligase